MIKILIVILFFTQSSFAVNYFYDKDLPIPKGAKIKIFKYEKVADGIFKAYIVDADGEGAFYTRAEHLSKSVKSLSFKTVHKKPKSLVGTTFILDLPLDTVVPPPVELIKQKSNNN